MTNSKLNNLLRHAMAASIGLVLISPVSAQSTSDDDSMRSMTESVLSGLGVQTKKPKPKPTTANSSEPDENSGMRDLTNSVLAGLGGAQTVQKTVPDGEAGLSVLISRALSEGKSDAYLTALLNEAVETGEVVVPDDLRTANRGLDTEALISVLRSETASTDGGRNTEAVMKTGVEASRFPFAEMDLSISGGRHFYRIKPDDSLTGIALRAYGDAALFTRVFEANTDRLESPNLIHVGQRLYIPDIR
jgi:nucleoid-associated protein YgaU